MLWKYKRPFAGLKSGTDIKKVPSTTCSELDLMKLKLTLEFNDFINSDEPMNFDIKSSQTGTKILKNS